jgi:hypothetical protein
MTTISSQRLLKALRRRAPRTTGELQFWLAACTGLSVPATPLTPGHTAPLAYLAHAYFEGGDQYPCGDCVVSACRGGGKTQLGAALSLLEALFKPGIQIRILGGSLEQSQRMYTYLLTLCERGFAPQLKGKPQTRRIHFRNGSLVEVLAQSQTSVRGVRVQRLRCDEVELFDPAIWDAAQLTTRSLLRPGQPPIHASIEAVSTAHIPGGLMSQLLHTAPTRPTAVFRWNILDVMQTCPPERDCTTCPLTADCNARARQARGFVPIADVIAMQRRVSRWVWQHEMLCQPPRFADAVFPDFDPRLHVGAVELSAAGMLHGWPDAPADTPARLHAGVDFGFAGCFFCLWLAGFRAADGQWCWAVLDEYVAERQTLAQCVAAMLQRPRTHRWPAVSVYGCDIAGNHTNPQTGQSDLDLLRKSGCTVRASAQRIEPGLRHIETLLAPAVGPPRLRIHPRCTRLIAAFLGYRRSAHGTGEPLKDGHHDHPLDALRYALTAASPHPHTQSTAIRWY